MSDIKTAIQIVRGHIKVNAEQQKAARISIQALKASQQTKTQEFYETVGSKVLRRYETRHLHLVLAFLRNRPKVSCESKSHENPSPWAYRNILRALGLDDQYVTMNQWCQGGPGYQRPALSEAAE